MSLEGLYLQLFKSQTLVFFCLLFSPVPGEVAPTPTSPENRGGCEARAREAVQVDSTLPTTSVQIRLADGSRLVANLNHTHTIADLRNYIVTYPFKTVVPIVAAGDPIGYEVVGKKIGDSRGYHR